MVQILFVLAIGIGVGAVTAWFSIQRSHGIGAINIGVWTAWPFAGGSEADPYTVARVISDSAVPLGAAEGLAFETQHDDDGEPLRLECAYRLEGTTPPARLWTLTPYRLDNRPIESLGEMPVHASSHGLLWFPDGTFHLTVGGPPAPGNWIAARGEGRYRLVMRLYDTPITSSSGLVDPVMPRVIALGCAS